MSLRTTYLVQKWTNLLVLNVIYLKIEGVKNNKIICKHFGRIELSKQRTGTCMISRMKYGCRIWMSQVDLYDAAHTPVARVQMCPRFLR